MSSPLLDAILRVALTFCAAAAFIVAFAVVTRSLGRTRPALNRFRSHAEVPLGFLALGSVTHPLVALLELTLTISASTWALASIVVRLLLVVNLGWLINAIGLFIIDIALGRIGGGEDVEDMRVRQIHTQTLIVRRLVFTVVLVITVGAALFTLPKARTLGTSVLASAGLISIIAALAAQSLLGNVFAGIHIAFSSKLRIGDVVYVEEQFGKVEELTLSYVVVRIWNDRRMILPTTYFATTPFQNWSRHGRELVGIVDVDVDWSVDINGIRAELDRLMAVSPHWDGRFWECYVIDATKGWITVEVLVTAADSRVLFDLRAEVREAVVTWVRENTGTPRQRVQLVDAPTPVNPVAPVLRTMHENDSIGVPGD